MGMSRTGKNKIRPGPNRSAGQASGSTEANTGAQSSEQKPKRLSPSQSKVARRIHIEYRWSPIPLHHEGRLVLKSGTGLSFQVEIKGFNLGEEGTWQKRDYRGLGINQISVNLIIL